MSGISELTGMNPIRDGNSKIAFFNAGGNNATRLAHCLSTYSSKYFGT